MKRKTYLGRSIDIADVKAQYDAEAKRIISDKTILAWIAKYTIQELKEYSIPVIISCMDGEPEVSEVSVHPGRKRPESLSGLATEDKVPNEGWVTFDVRFSLITPDQEKIKIIVNVEIQKDFYPGYDLVTRAIFYCARMLSAIMICLNKKSYLKKKSRLHGLLGTIFSEDLKPEEKALILDREYDIKTEVEVREGMGKMCNLSDAIEERGIRKGLIQGEKKKMIELICRKIKKGKSLSKIAEELEEDESTIAHIYETALSSAPNYEWEKVYASLHGE